jgi:anti-sigma factor RsiW
MSAHGREEQLAALVDGELEAAARTELEAHLSTCTACSARAAELRELSKKVREGASRPEPDPEQIRRLGRALRMDRPGQGRSGKLARTAALSKYILVAAAAGVLAWIASMWWLRPTAEQRIGEEIVAAHVRSLQADHLTDVASSDRHTVNPWFQGKIDCAVGARDHAEKGYPLAGGRLDYVDGRAVAAVVYRHGPHALNLFVWSTRPGESARSGELAVRGYRVVHWASGETERWLVSDADPSTVQALAELVRADE